MAKIGEVLVEVNTGVSEKSLKKAENRFKKFGQRVKKVAFNPLTLAAAAAGAAMAAGMKKVTAEFDKGSDVLDGLLKKLDDLSTTSNDIGATELGTQALTEALKIRGINDTDSFLKDFQQVIADNPALRAQFEQAGVSGTGNQLLSVLGGLSKIKDPQERARQAKQLGLNPKQIGELTGGDFTELFDKQVKELKAAGFEEGLAGKAGKLQEEQAIETVRRERNLLIQGGKSVNSGAVQAQARVLEERQKSEITALKNIESNANAAQALAVASNKTSEVFNGLVKLITEKFIPAINDIISKFSKFGEFLSNPLGIFSKK